MASASDANLAFVRMTTPVPNTYVGGIMVTDSRGMPLAFQYTEPIQPNKIQQILYGQSLSRYIKQDVMLSSLLRGLNADYSCVLVDDDHLLTSAIMRQLGAAVIRVSDTNNVNRLKEAGAIEALSAHEFLLQPTQQANPIRCRLAYEDDADDSGQTGETSVSIDDGRDTPERLLTDGSSSATLTTVAATSVVSDIAIPPILENVLVPAAAQMDLVEPLRRIDKALEAICQEAGVGAN